MRSVRSSEMGCLSLAFAITLPELSFAGAVEQKILDLTSLSAAEHRWNQSTPSNYHFTLKYSEFASPCKAFSYTIHVRGNRPSGHCRNLEPNISTVPQTFRCLRSPLDSRHYLVHS